MQHFTVVELFLGRLLRGFNQGGGYGLRSRPQGYRNSNYPPNTFDRTPVSGLCFTFKQAFDTMPVRLRFYPLFNLGGSLWLILSSFITVATGIPKNRPGPLRGARGAGAVLIAIDAEGNLAEGDWATLEAADAIIFGSPIYMGMASWQFKKFADASSKPWFAQKWKNKIAAGFTNFATMNGDKLSTLHYLFTLAMQHSMVWVGTGMMPANSKAAQRNDVNYVGSSSGAMSATPSDASPDEMLPGDLETARQFGQRVAEVTGQFAAGRQATLR